MLDYASIDAVASVVREGSFERAASVLGVTRSAISQRVRTLEDRLGTILVVRGKPCTATRTGARLCAHVERVRLLEGEMAATLPALARQAMQSGRPTIRIAVNADSLGAWFMPALAAFAAKHEALIDLVLEGEDHTAERLRSGEVLAAVTTDTVRVQGCRMIPLGALRYVATAAPEFSRRWFPQGLNAEALSRAPVLRFDQQDWLQAQWARRIAGADLAGAPVHWIPSTHGFIDATLAGIGWSMNPLCMVQDHLTAGRLIDLSPGEPLDVPLHWQSARIGTGLLDRLADEVVKIALLRLIRDDRQPADAYRKGSQTGTT